MRLETIVEPTGATLPADAKGVKSNRSKCDILREHSLAIGRLQEANDAFTARDIRAILSRRKAFCPGRKGVLHEASWRLFKAVRDRAFKRYQGQFQHLEKMDVDSRGWVFLETTKKQLLKWANLSESQYRTAKRNCADWGIHVTQHSIFNFEQNRYVGSRLRVYLDADRVEMVYRLKGDLLAEEVANRVTYFNEIIPEKWVDYDGSRDAIDRISYNVYHSGADRSGKSLSGSEVSGEKMLTPTRGACGAAEKLKNFSGKNEDACGARSRKPKTLDELYARQDAEDNAAATPAKKSDDTVWSSLPFDGDLHLNEDLDTLIRVIKREWATREWSGVLTNGLFEQIKRLTRLAGKQAPYRLTPKTFMACLAEADTLPSDSVISRHNHKMCGLHPQKLFTRDVWLMTMRALYRAARSQTRNAEEFGGDMAYYVNVDKSDCEAETHKALALLTQAPVGALQTDRVICTREGFKRITTTEVFDNTPRQGIEVYNDWLTQEERDYRTPIWPLRLLRDAYLGVLTPETQAAFRYHCRDPLAFVWADEASGGRFSALAGDSKWAEAMRRLAIGKQQRIDWLCYDTEAAEQKQGRIQKVLDEPDPE